MATLLAAALPYLMGGTEAAGGLSGFSGLANILGGGMGSMAGSTMGGGMQGPTEGSGLMGILSGGGAIPNYSDGPKNPNSYSGLQIPNANFKPTVPKY